MKPSRKINQLIETLPITMKSTPYSQEVRTAQKTMLLRYSSIE